MTKKFLLITILGIFTIYGCSQKAQEPQEENLFTGESFSYSDITEKVKCEQSGGKAEDGTCSCPKNHKNDGSGFCEAEDGSFGGDIGEALKGQ